MFWNAVYLHVEVFESNRILFQEIVGVSRDVNNTEQTTEVPRSWTTSNLKAR